MAVVGSEAAFDLGRQQLELLAGLHVSTKSVERQAEKIGAEIMRLEQAEIQHSVQLQLPIPLGPPLPVMYVEIDSTGIPGRPDRGLLPCQRACAYAFAVAVFGMRRRAADGPTSSCTWSTTAKSSRS